MKSVFSFRFYVDNKWPIGDSYAIFFTDIEQNNLDHITGVNIFSLSIP